jgi:methionyl aminopeptidase
MIEVEDYKRAGKILEEILIYAKKIIKKDSLLIEIAEKIEEFVKSKNAKLAFPPNLSINEIAAHYSPFSNDNTIARGLLKVDVGIIFNSCIADAAITIDLEKNEENRKMIKSNLKALKEGIRVIKPGIKVCEVGKAIERVISKEGYKPIFNLTGHSIDKSLHGSKSIPNFDNKDETLIEENEIIAIEPFLTLKDAIGYVEDGRPSAIWKINKDIRPRLHREIFNYIKNNYNNFPFSQRWIEKKFQNAYFALKIFEKQGILYNYKELVEKSGAKVSQAETTIIVKEKPIILVDVFDI